MFSFIQNIDNLILDRINTIFHSSFLDEIMPVITRLGNNGFIWIAIAVIFILTKKYRTTGIIMLCALGVSALIGNLILKPLIARERPCFLNTDYKLLIPRPQDFSFPSGHTMSSFTASTVLFIRHRKFGIAALVLAATIAFSRLYLYVHYPSDILAGLLMGAAIAILCSYGYQYKIEDKKIIKS
ncbi:undecaprenyl-diphosphatase [Mobilisporobacter senegalensis]|uniref:Undecaprenyl-diphosphatase n=1 Tax=Mobilisporobacter senegalensis TaxID=1329262 RepID=A0A3N1XVK4_9FIRM|nr:phosphatase PAP2 family protein [Mobilisporobacter senegalensis]ROR30655.1 undecaprenyl-diphosphatase [Mobilisporobacter senegalensis]